MAPLSPPPSPFLSLSFQSGRAVQKQALGLAAGAVPRGAGPEPQLERLQSGGRHGNALDQRQVRRMVLFTTLLLLLSE